MFATHYHELTELAAGHEGIHNLSVAAAEDGNDVVFLHNIIEGPASKSYGIHVARIAGIPETIRSAARKKLRELESVELMTYPEEKSAEQISFMPDEVKDSRYEKYSRLEAKLRALDINTMTPVAALVALQEITEEAKEND
jgi:DNA mismatch repair protein MutS